MAYNQRQQYPPHRAQPPPPSNQWQRGPQAGATYGYQQDNSYQASYAAQDYGYEQPQQNGGQGWGQAQQDQYNYGYDNYQQQPMNGGQDPYYDQQDPNQQYYDQGYQQNHYYTGHDQQYNNYDQQPPQSQQYSQNRPPQQHAQQQRPPPSSTQDRDRRRPGPMDPNKNPKPRERILQPEPDSPSTMPWDNPFPVFNPKKKEEQKKHSSLEKNMGDMRLGDSRPPERPHTSHGHKQEDPRSRPADVRVRSDDGRPRTSHGQGRSDPAQRPFGNEGVQAPPPPPAQVPGRKPVPPRIDALHNQPVPDQNWRGSQGSDKDLPLSPTGRANDRSRYQDPQRRDVQRSNPETQTSPRRQNGTAQDPTQDRRGMQNNVYQADTNGRMPVSQQQNDWQTPANVGHYYGPPDRSYLDPRPASATDGRPIEKPSIDRAGSDEPRPNRMRSPPTQGTDPRYQNHTSTWNSQQPVQQPVQAPEMPNFDALQNNGRQTDEFGQTIPINAPPAAKPAYQKATYQPSSSVPAAQSSITTGQGERDPALGQFAFGLPSGPKSARSPNSAALPPAQHSPPRGKAPIQTSPDPYGQQATPGPTNPQPYNGNGAYPNPNGMGNARMDPKANATPQQHPQAQQPQYPPNGVPRDTRNQPGPRPGQQQFPPRTASRPSHSAGNEGVSDWNGQPQYGSPYDQQYQQQGYDNTYDQGYGDQGNAIAQQQSGGYNNPQQIPTQYSQPGYGPPPNRPQQPGQGPSYGSQDSRRSPGDPPMSASSSMTSNSRPTPVRPGLSPQNDGFPPADKPAPVRQYGQQTSSQASLPAQPSVQEKRVSAPITAQDLSALQQQVRAKPQDFALGLRYAKKLVEAASVLANDGGRADAKTAQKNRDNYMMDAHKQVKKLVAGGYTEAMFYLADCYGSGGMGLQSDPREAFHLYQTAAKQGHAPSAYRAAVCCELGNEEGGGTKRDAARAVSYYRRAANLGDAPAMYKMGMIMLKGLLGQQKDRREGLNWLQRAAERADAENPHALHELGLLYETAAPGDCVVRDPRHARELFEKAARLGYKFSQFRLASAYEYGGLDCPVDARQSILWYTKAASLGEHQSELALSGWYLTGAEGILQQSDTEAYLWARKSAMSGLAKAEYAMGYFTEVGIGVGANIEEAKKWYWRAAAQNFEKARERLEALKKGGINAKMQKTRVSRSNISKQGEGECIVM